MALPFVLNSGGLGHKKEVRFKLGLILVILEAMARIAQIKLIQILVFILLMHFLSFDLAFAMSGQKPENCLPSSFKLILQTEAMSMDLKTKKLTSQLIQEPLPLKLGADQLSTGKVEILAENLGKQNVELLLTVSVKKSAQVIEKHTSLIAAKNKDKAKETFIKVSEIKALTRGEALILNFSNQSDKSQCPIKVEYHAAD